MPGWLRVIGTKIQWIQQIQEIWKITEACIRSFPKIAKIGNYDNIGIRGITTRKQQIQQQNVIQQWVLNLRWLRLKLIDCGQQCLLCLICQKKVVQKCSWVNRNLWKSATSHSKSKRSTTITSFFALHSIRGNQSDERHLMQTSVSGIKHFYWAQLFCLPCRGTLYVRRRIMVNAIPFKTVFYVLQITLFFMFPL